MLTRILILIVVWALGSSPPVNTGTPPETGSTDSIRAETALIMHQTRPNTQPSVKGMPTLRGVPCVIVPQKQGGVARDIEFGLNLSHLYNPKRLTTRLEEAGIEVCPNQWPAGKRPERLEVKLQIDGAVTESDDVYAYTLRVAVTETLLRQKIGQVLPHDDRLIADGIIWSWTTIEFVTKEDFSARLKEAMDRGIQAFADAHRNANARLQKIGGHGCEELENK